VIGNLLDSDETNDCLRFDNLWEIGHERSST
jgi:hypothetical protein